MKCTSVKNGEKIINDLLLWIKSFSWEEDDKRTDAVMDITIGGIAGSHIEDVADVSLINTKIVKQVVLRKAEQFTDVHVIEEMNWQIVDSLDEVGHCQKTIHIQAAIHLAEPGFHFDEADSFINN